jgi:crotonobetainyl-CoA:carnitine CoA-transferase CaiB-like acyl-CoA transferase
VLDIDEVLRSQLVLAREMVVEISQPAAEDGAQARLVRQLGTPIKLGRTPADPARAPGPGFGEHTEEVLAEAGFSAEEIAELLASGAVGGRAGAPEDGSFLA